MRYRGIRGLEKVIECRYSWSESHNAAIHVIAQLFNQRKSQELATETSPIYWMGNLKVKGKGPVATPHHAWSAAGKTQLQYGYTREEEASSYRGHGVRKVPWLPRWLLAHMLLRSSFPQLLFPVDDQTYWSPGSGLEQSLAGRGVGGGRVCLIMQMVTD